MFHILYFFNIILNSVEQTEQDPEEEIKVNCPCGNDEVCAMFNTISRAMFTYFLFLVS